MKITARQLEAVLVLHKSRPEVHAALAQHFLHDATLEASGELCGMTKQGFAYHVKKVLEIHQKLQESVEVLKRRK